MSRRWSASLSAEMAKLRFKEPDWKLSRNSATTRTRYGGNGRPDLRRRKALEEVSESEDSEWSQSYGSEEREEDLYLGKPEATRVIVEVSAITKAFEENCSCPRCRA